MDSLHSSTETRLTRFDSLPVHRHSNPCQSHPRYSQVILPARALEDDPSTVDSGALSGAFEHLEDEHEAAASLLADIRANSDDYAIPEDACTSYRNVLDRLEILEGDMHRHVHTENNVLFPEAEALLETR
ncbi:hemerythrin domain-containing protein [Natrarchaeobius sp. A-rgal3]|uniref:hemerythrin domain-containing protein n=1 Tax=Natrarchaeobius versutus TaxID=1679078 RepID=UPI0035104A21